MVTSAPRRAADGGPARDRHTPCPTPPRQAPPSSQESGAEPSPTAEARTNYYLLPDLQGHTRQLTNAAGAIFEPHIYDAWGREIWPIVTTGLYLRGFGQWGYWRDTATREYVRARHLGVDLGRWVSRDPIQGGPPFAYALCSPAKLVDPTGLFIRGSVGSVADLLAKRVDATYTCRCGWIDGTHFSGATMAAQMHLYFGTDSRFRLPFYGFVARHHGGGIPFLPVRIDVAAGLRVALPPPGLADVAWQRAAAFVAFRLLWLVELEQSRYPGLAGSAFPYEDLPTDWLGAVTWWRYGNRDNRQALRLCGDSLTKDQVREIYCNMTEGCMHLKSSCHLFAQVQTTKDINPLPYATLFHKRHPSTQGYCASESVPPELASPPTVFTDRVQMALLDWIADPGFPDYWT
jgi:RHS repeat-associated protein